jgi:hypothetical protein
MRSVKIKRFAVMGLLLAISIVACHKEEKAVVGVAQDAVNAEHKAQAAAQATATERDQQRAALAAIALPTKSMYVNVRDANVWANPFLSVGAESLDLRVNLADASASPVAGRRAQPHTAAARSQHTEVRPDDLARAVVALPPSAWRYGRVIAVAESPQANRKDRTKVRRNVEDAIQELHDLGIVVQEWPTR